MPTHEQVLRELEHWMSEIQVLRSRLASLRPQSFIEEEQGLEDYRKQLENQMRGCGGQMIEVLEKLERFPHRYVRHYDKLKEFSKESNFEDSVFLMTKYPESGEAGADKLQAVIAAVEEGVRSRRYTPRMPVTKAHHRWLWDNVELYLLGCARGIAIVEDRYLPELNPNVAMEWGWMTGMGRDVLFLRESGFRRARADWQGLISFEFDWDDPKPGVEKALDGGFLPPKT